MTAEIVDTVMIMYDTIDTISVYFALKVLFYHLEADNEKFCHPHVMT